MNCSVVFESKASVVTLLICFYFLAWLLYADDVCLIAPSRGAVQKMLDICFAF